MAAHPMLRPLGRRIAVTLVCVAWAGLEAWFEPDGVWLPVALGATGFALWDFFLSGNYRS
jgi:hypothetical protein